MHEAPAITGSGEGSMYAVLPLHAKRLFPEFKPVTSKSQWSNLTVTLRLTLNTFTLLMTHLFLAYSKTSFLNFLPSSQGSKDMLKLIRSILSKWFQSVPILKSTQNMAWILGQDLIHFEYIQPTSILKSTQTLAWIWHQP